MDVQVHLHHFEMAPGTAVPVISACAAQCVHKMFEEADCYLMEPVMFMEVGEFLSSLFLEGHALTDMSHDARKPVFWISDQV